MSVCLSVALFPCCIYTNLLVVNLRVIFCPRKETQVRKINRQKNRIKVKSTPRSLLQLKSKTFQSNLDTKIQRQTNTGEI